jgi:hypothetical protein
VRGLAAAQDARARARIQGVLARAGLPASAAQDLPGHIARFARVTLSFHPDRLLADGCTVVEALAQDGVYKSQFETGISNGSRTAFPGGDRDRWEQSLFGGAYHQDDAQAADRPRYGALNLMRHGDGASPRFGSCYLVLREELTAACSFTWGDSHLGPADVGTLDAFAPLLAALLESAETQAQTLGVRGLGVSGLLDALARLPEPPGAAGRALDDYIEAQVHAAISIRGDIEALVIDPCFDGTSTGAQLRALGAAHGFPVRTHPGFVLDVREVPADFRGPRMAPLAQRIDQRFTSARGQLDAAAVGRAAASLHREPAAWADWGSPDETLQHLKQLWHVLVAYGRPR